jgi:hypothetical protein
LMNMNVFQSHCRCHCPMRHDIYNLSVITPSRLVA